MSTMKFSSRLALRHAVDLPHLDYQIIEALQNDGRASYASLAERFGSTERVVRSHVQSLRESQVIDVSAATHPFALGYRCVAIVGLTVAHVPRTTVADSLDRAVPQDFVVSTTGRYQMLTQVFSRSLLEMQQILDSDIGVLPGVDVVEAHLYLQRAYEQTSFHMAADKNLEQKREPDPLELNELDVSIIEQLSIDGRMPFQQMARHLGVSHNRIRGRVAKLNAAGILRVQAFVNPMTLGFENIAMVGITLGEGAQARSVASELENLELVTFVAVCAGRFAIFAEVVSRSSAELFRVIDDQIRAVPGVGHVECFVYLDMHTRAKVPQFFKASGTA